MLQGRGRLVSGILLALGAALFYNLGLAIQKRNAQSLPKVSGFSWATVKAFVTSVGWLGGNGLTLVGWICQFFALLRAPIGLVQPTMAAGVGFLAFIAVRWFHEKLRAWEWAGVAACSAGILLLALSVDPRRELAARRMDAPALILSIGLLVFIAAAGLLVSRRTSRVEVLLGCAAGVLYAGTGLLTKALGIALFDDKNLLVALVTLVVMLGLALTALWVLQAAYQQGRAIVVITLMGVLADFVPVLVSRFVFHEEWPRAGRGVIRLVAFAVIVTGFGLLARPAAVIEEAVLPDAAPSESESEDSGVTT